MRNYAAEFFGTFWLVFGVVVVQFSLQEFLNWELVTLVFHSHLV